MTIRLRSVLIAASSAAALLAPASGWANTCLPTSDAASVSADGDGGAAAAAVARLSPGESVRVRLIGSVALEGHYAGVREGFLLLRGKPPGNTPSEASLARIEGLWVRRSAARRGAVLVGSLGLLAGATLGLVGGSLSCLDAGSDCSATGPALLGAAVGSALGAGTGAIIGAAAGQWSRVYPGLETGEPVRAGQSPRRWAGRQWSFGVGRTLPFDDADSGGWSARTDLGTAGERVAFALEIGWHRRVWLAGPVVRVFSSSGRWRPYALGGLGVGSELVVSLGAGVRRSGSLPLSLEGRWHVRGLSIAGGRNFATVQASVAFAAR